MSKGGTTMNLQAFYSTLPVMGLGMLGIFIVMAVIALGITVLNKLFK